MPRDTQTQGRGIVFTDLNAVTAENAVLIGTQRKRSLIERASRYAVFAFVAVVRPAIAVADAAVGTPFQ